MLGLRLMVKRGWMLTKRQQDRSSFFSLKGVLKSKGDVDTDKKMIDDYLKDKYDL